MENRGFFNQVFEVFYASKEDSNCPLIPLVIKTGREIEEQKKDVDIIFSVRYGGRMLSNTIVDSFENINIKDFFEIIDYDPVKKVLLTIGTSKPTQDIPVHWIIQHARKDIHAIVQINSYDKLNKYNYPVVEKKQDILEMAKNILKELRENNIIKIEEKGLIFTGKSVELIKNDILKTFLEEKID